MLPTGAPTHPTPLLRVATLQQPVGPLAVRPPPRPHLSPSLLPPPAITHCLCLEQHHSLYYMPMSARSERIVICLMLLCGYLTPYSLSGLWPFDLFQAHLCLEQHHSDQAFALLDAKARLFPRSSYLMVRAFHPLL